MSDRPQILLVHGAWGSPGLWDLVAPPLRAENLEVAVADLPTMKSASATLSDDADHVRSLARNGSTVLVGHSYGGAVITEAAAGLDAAHLVYLASVILDVGETFFEWVSRRDAGGPPLDLRDDGTAMVTQWGDPDRYDIEAEALFERNPPRPFAVGAALTPVSAAPWHDVPSTFVLAEDDLVIHPDTQHEVATRASRTITVPGGHLVHGSHPLVVIDLIREVSAPP